MKAIVIYNSATGFTKRYAEWISGEASCECVELKNTSKINLMDYDAVVFGGWCKAGSISKLSWMKKRIPSLSAAGKKIIVYAVGASPADSPDIPEAMRRNFTDEQRSLVKVFYCPGGLDYEKMGGMSKFMMKMLAKTLASKKDATDKDKRMAEMISKSYDISDKKYAQQIADELK